MKTPLRGPLSLVLSFWVGLSGCSSDDSNGTPGAGGSSPSTGGASGAGGAQSAGGQGTAGQGNGGRTGTGGQSAGGQGTSGATGTGGQGAGGQAAGGQGGGAGASGGGGAAGSSGGSAGAGGSMTGDGGPGSDSGSVTGFTLTSSAYTNGMMIPAVHTCAGANTSPPLTWTPGPSGTKSYTLIFTDKTNSLVHWALWDIPVATTSLPAALAAGMPAGSHGASIGGNGGAYSGPCPSGTQHTYQFDLYAVDVATLPISATSMQPAVVTSVMSHKLAIASLSGTSNAKRP